MLKYVEATKKKKKQNKTNFNIKRQSFAILTFNINAAFATTGQIQIIARWRTLQFATNFTKLSRISGFQHNSHLATSQAMLSKFPVITVLSTPSFFKKAWE